MIQTKGASHMLWVPEIPVSKLYPVM